MPWKPDVTVAAVIEQQGRYLLVEELQEGVSVFNQPAGHLEAGENLPAAVIREVLEETTRVFTPTAALGVYLWHNPAGVTYLRVAFSGTCSAPLAGRTLDTGIIATHWLTHAEIIALGARLRSPLVLRCIEDYEAGQRFSLSCFQQLN
jgi:ADP-ribose pyrophosphatase YjhB (NUDIX family)